MGRHEIEAEARRLPPERKGKDMGHYDSSYEFDAEQQRKAQAAKAG